MAGYSGKPLAAKLGYSGPVWRLDMPDDTAATIAGDGDILWCDTPSDAGAAHLFVTRRAQLAEALDRTLATLPKDAMVWVSWPKKSSKMPSEVTEDVIREIALPLGYVDIKVCAVDETWSGLKLMIRKDLR